MAIPRFDHESLPPPPHPPTSIAYERCGRRGEGGEREREGERGIEREGEGGRKAEREGESGGEWRRQRRREREKEREGEREGPENAREKHVHSSTSVASTYIC